MYYACVALKLELSGVLTEGADRCSSAVSGQNGLNKEVASKAIEALFRKSRCWGMASVQAEATDVCHLVRRQRLQASKSDLARCRIWHEIDQSAADGLAVDPTRQRLW